VGCSQESKATCLPTFIHRIKLSTLKEDIPKIEFDREQDPRVEVVDFKQLVVKLDRSKDHNPFSVHKIEFYLILLVTKGTYTHFVDFKSYELREGSALFIAKNQVHHFTESLSDAGGLGIIFSSLFADKHQLLSQKLQLNRLFNYHIETPVIHQEELGGDSFLEIGEILLREYKVERVFAKAEMLSSLLHILLLRAERAKETQSIDGIKPQWLETFSAFRDLLEEKYTSSRSSRDYASKLFISYKFLNDIVKKLSGKTAKAFIDDFVTIEIKRQLVTTSLTVKEISYQTGFEEPANMVKFFKKKTGLTPLKFRQRI